MAIDELYNNTFIVKTPTWANDHGSTTQTLSDGISFSGRIRLLNAFESKEYGKERVLSTHRLYCDTSNTISATSEITDKNGFVYDVLFINNPHEMDEFYQVELSLRV